jgi:hypothetical protein
MAGGKGLTWGEFSKRYEANWRVIYDRIRNNEPFTLLDPHRLTSDDGVHVYFRMVGISIPDPVGNNRWKPNNTYIEINPRLFTSFDNFYSGKNSPIPMLTALRNSSGIGFERAPIKINFYTSTRKSPTNAINSGRVLKDPDFGGKIPRGQQRNIFWGRMKYYNDEVDTSYTLHYPTSTEQGEADFINTFNRQLDDILTKENIPCIDLEIGNKTFHNVVGVNKVAGTPKADLAFVALRNRKLVEVAWCSHKMGSTAKDFGQWGGVTHFQKGTFRELDEFVDYVKQTVGINKLFDLTKMGPTTFGMDVSDINLEMQSVYGKLYGQSSEGPSNCTAVLQGTPSISKSGSNYKLNMSAHLMPNGTRMSGDYRPVLMLIKKASTEKILDRSVGGVRSDYGIRGARVVVSSVGGRTITHRITKNKQGQFITVPA